MRFIRLQIDEIRGDKALRWYGACLALVNLATAVYWLVQAPRLQDVIDPSRAPVCWPFFDPCRSIRILEPQVTVVILAAFGATAILNAWLFLRPQFVTGAYWLLCGLSVFKAGVLLQDYRLLLNQHYMAYWITLPFLFVPGKRLLSKYLLVAFYLWAGVLKFNREWILGLALYGRLPLGLPAAFVPVECVYVIVLETVVAFGLLSRRRIVFWAAFGQFALFHLSSFWVVGFFYPTLMFLLLAIFPLSRRGLGLAWAATAEGPEMQSGSPWQQGLRYGVVGLLCAAQLIPHAFPGDPSLTGEGRAFALHMFDAPLECRATANYHFATGLSRAVVIRPVFTTPRLACDPIVYISLARDLCGHGTVEITRADFDLVLRSRKIDQARYATVLAIGDFCRTMPRYSMWRHNPWILTSATEVTLGTPALPAGQ